MLDTERYIETLSDLIDRRTELLNKAPDTPENRDYLRDQTYKLLVLYRMKAQIDIRVLEYSGFKEREIKREEKKLEKQNIAFPLAVEYIKKYSRLKEAAAIMLISKGETIAALLRCWQMLGATREDLCNLCNNNKPGMLEEMAKEPPNATFADLVCLYDIEGKDEIWVHPEDAPLTHAVLFWVSSEAEKYDRKTD